MAKFSAEALKNASRSNKNLIVTSGDDKKSYTQDERFWKLSRDSKTGNGTALIRFLPSLEANQLPWVQTFSYFIKGPTGRYYVENSRRTLGQPDPMREYIHERWQSAQTEMEKNVLRSSMREKMDYISNILVINDPVHPENNGKVMLYRYGKKIMEKIIAKTQDEFGDSCNVFDWMEGCDFKLRAKVVQEFVNYDSSEFGGSKPVGDDRTIERIAESMHDLSEFTNPSQFKSYEELKARVDDEFRYASAKNAAAAAEFESPARSTVSEAKPAVSAMAAAASAAQANDAAPWDEPVAPTQKAAASTTFTDDDINTDDLMKELENL